MIYDRFVLYHPDFGIYVGCLSGMGIWSRDDHREHRQEAVAFRSEAAAWDHMKKWDTFHPGTAAMAVRTADRYRATEAECAAAGLPPWKPTDAR